MLSWQYNNLFHFGEKYTFVLCAVNRTGCFYIHFMYLYIHYK